MMERTKKRIGNHLRAVRVKIAKRKLDYNRKNFDGINILDEEDLSEHYGDEKLIDVGFQHVVKSFTIDRINFIREVLGKDQITKDSFADLGDSSGIFIRAFKKNALSVNISPEALKNIKAKGIEAVKADIEKLPFRNDQFDHILLFETLEHVPEPITTLQEISRVCKKSAIISIPYVSKTNILRYNYDPNMPLYQHHIFEFDDRDLRSIVSHTDFTVDSYKTVNVFDTGINVYYRLIVALWNRFFERDLFFGCFKKFTIYHLVKKNKLQESIIR